jgi:uncharacterized protein YdbL (DUF1318 family)
MRTTIKVAGFLAVFLILSCVTVNIYFPSAEVQKAADKIVDDVRTRGNDMKTEPAPSPAPGPSSRMDFLAPFSIAPGQAYAATDIDVSTPAIRGIKESMKNRFPQLKPFYDKGALGENNKGQVEAKDSAVLTLQERGQLNKLIDQENKDRAALYSEIATANKLGPEAVPQIEKIFANSWRDKSQPGWWVQDDNGVWGKK